MKKRLLACLVTAGMCMSGTVFAADLTAEEVLEKMNAYSADAESMAAEMKLSLDGALNLAMGSDPVISNSLVLDAEFKADEITSPMQLGMEGTMKMSLTGESTSVNMNMYTTMDEESNMMDTYMDMTSDGYDTGWMHTQTDLTEIYNSFGVNSLEELKGMNMNDMFAGLDLTWELTENDSTYTLSTTFDFAQLSDLVEAALAAGGQGDDMMTKMIVETILSSLKMNVSYFVDKETFAPVVTNINFNDSDLSTINALLAAMVPQEEGSENTSEVILNNFSIDMISDYNCVDEILIPADALATPVTDVEELATELQ